MYWYWISLSYATFGIAVDENLIVVRTAPIGKWMTGKHLGFIQNWVKKKGGIVKELRGQTYDTQENHCDV